MGNRLDDKIQRQAELDTKATESPDQEPQGSDEQRAYALVSERHAAQTWGGYPYTEHLRRVVATVSSFAPRVGLGDRLSTLRLAAWLHDIVEDTNTTVDEVRSLFGHEVADLVWRLTDEPGQSRREKKARTYPKLRASREATFVKLCDRLVNVHNSVTPGPSARYLGMYRSEQGVFRVALGREEEFRVLWDEIEKLLSEPPA